MQTNDFDGIDEIDLRAHRWSGRSARWLVGSMFAALLAAFVIAPGDGAMPASAAAEPPAGSVRYVSPTGNDAAAGLTAQAPWKTLTFALSEMEPGQTLRVLPGVYQETTSGLSRIAPTLKSGTPTQRITVQATSPDVEIRSTLTLSNADYWTFEGLNITGLDAVQGGARIGTMLELRGGTGWIFRNAEVCCYGAYTLVSIAGDAKNWTFSHNLVWSNRGRGSQNDTDHNIYVQTFNNPNNPAVGTSGPGYIERNILAGARNGANIKLGQGSTEVTRPPGNENKPPYYGPLNVVVRNNTLVGAHENVRLAFRAQNSLIEDNLMVHANLLQNGGQFAVDPYCLLNGGNITRNNAWSAITPTNPDEQTTSAPTGPNAAALEDGCDNLPAGTLTDQGGHVARNPLFNTGQSGSTGATTALTEKTMHASGNALGQVNPSHFQPADAVARTYGRHAPFDQVVAGDWDGNGTDTPGGIIGNRVYLTNRATDPGSTTRSVNAGEADRILAFGSVNGTDRYLAGDWDGDGKDEIGVYRPSNSTFYLEDGPSAFQFGSVNDSGNYHPIAGDWDGDGIDEVGLFRTDTKRVLLRNADGSVVAGGYQFGAAARTYQPVVGNWDGDSDDRDEIGLWEPATSTFHLRRCANDVTSCSGTGLTSVAVPTPTTSAVYQPVAGSWTKDDGSGDAQGFDSPAYVTWARGTP